MEFTTITRDGSKRLSLYIGLVTLEPDSAHPRAKEINLSFTNFLSFATDFDDFWHRAELFFQGLQFAVIEIEDFEEFEVRQSAFELNEDVKLAAENVRRSGEACIGDLHHHVL